MWNVRIKTLYTGSDMNLQLKHMNTKVQKSLKAHSSQKKKWTHHKYDIRTYQNLSVIKQKILSTNTPHVTGFNSRQA